jgi:hypothetical protein
MPRSRRKPKQSKAPAESPETKELLLAYKRINGAPARRLRWLLGFAEIDLDSLSEGRFADLRWEVVVFGLNRKPEQLKDRSKMAEEFYLLTVSPSMLDIDPALDDAATLQAKFQSLHAEQKKGAPPDMIRQFQLTMQTAFDTLFKPDYWIVKRPTAEEAISLNMRTPTGILLGQKFPWSRGHDILLNQAIDLIKAEKDRLKICENPKCRKRFVAAKKGRAFFHSPKCSAYVRVNRARGKMK